MEIYNKRLPTIKQLQYFLAICEENSFRKAALKLGVSQPPLSFQIQKLEEKLSTILLIRNTQRILLTKEGEIFRDKAMKLLEDLCLITSGFKTDCTNRIVLGMTKTLSFDFIPSFHKFINDFADKTEIYKHDYTSKELLNELQKGNIDYAIISDYHNSNQVENYLLIHQEPMMLALPKSHPASLNEKIDLNDVLDLPLFWFNRYLHPAYYDKCEQAFKLLNLSLIRRPELPDTLSMLLDISLGKGMLLLPKSMTQAEIAGVVYKELTLYFESKFLIDIFLVWDPSLSKDIAPETIANYIKNL